MSLKSLSIVAAAALALCAGAAQAQVAGLADGGFEIAPNSAGEFADGWQSAGAYTTRTNAEAHSGSYSALLGIPDNPNGGAGTGLFQNSVDHGGLLAVDPANWGTTPTLSFWVKGNVSVTGNLNYDLRYLDSSGHILNTSTSSAQTIWTGNVDHGWTQITRSGVAIPTGTSAVFLEMTLATGPTGPAVPCGVDNATGLPLTCNWGSAKVYVDDVNVTLSSPVAAVPETESYAMMLAGLGVVGGVVRRRRRSA